MATATVAGLLLVACSNADNQVEPLSLDTTPGAISSTGAASVVPTTAVMTTVVSSTSTAPPTTAAEVTTSSLDPLTGPMFSDALGVKVDTAPGVHTRGDTRQLLPEGLYVHLAWESDPNDFSVFSPRQEDIPILEAYVNASLAYYRSFITDLVVEPSAFAPYMTLSGDQYVASFAQATRDGYHGSLGSGVVLRPYVLADQRDESNAIVFDCYLQNEQFFLDGESPVLAPLAIKGTVATMVRVDGIWKVDVIAGDPDACL